MGGEEGARNATQSGALGRYSSKGISGKWALCGARRRVSLVI